MALGNCDVMAFVTTTQSARARAFYCDVLGLHLEEENLFAVVVKAANAIVRIEKVPAFTPLRFTVL